MGQVCSGSAGEEAAMSCPRSDAKRPGAAPKALGVCFSDFFGVGNLLGYDLMRLSNRSLDYSAPVKVRFYEKL